MKLVFPNTLSNRGETPEVGSPQSTVNLLKTQGFLFISHCYIIASQIPKQLHQTHILTPPVHK